jgi:glycosyltransferase involved in cell wall biosynthesis
MNNKIKVLIVCHFSNDMVRKHLPLDNRKIFNRIRGIFGLPYKGTEYADIASWDTNIIDNLSKRDDVDLYVISAHTGLKKSTVSFVLGNVKYWFIRCEVANMLKYVIKSPALWHKLNPMRPKVRRIVRRVNPDVIALIGAENAYYSGTVLGLENEYPIIVKAQTVYNNPKFLQELSSFDEKNSYVEKLIFNRMNYFAVNTTLHCSLFRQYNPKAYNFKWKLATTFPEVKPMKKEYDFVNFAMNMSPAKGFNDAIRALSIVRKKFPETRLNLIGGESGENINIIKKLIVELDLQNNVVLTPLFPKQSDMFQHIQKARFALLPCKLDSVSSTIVQAMYYELPVICYKTEGTVQLNQEEEKVLIAENGNYEDLAKQMLRFMSEPETTERLKIAAKIDIDMKNDNQKLTEQIVANLKAVIANFRNGTEVPTKLLFD